MKRIYFELCGETLEAAQAAQAGGADRIELCSELRIGGVTPDISLVTAAVEAVQLPVHVLVRPRGGDFVYSREEFELMLEQIEQNQRAGVQGVVVGVLTAQGKVDVPRTKALVEAAKPMRVTFHRAFDECVDLSEALDAVMETGADAVLTSGGAADVHAGAAMIGELGRRANGRVQIIGGGGLRLDSLADLIRETGVTWTHGSLTSGAANGRSAHDRETLEAAVRKAVSILQQSEEAAGGTGADSIRHE